MLNDLKKDAADRMAKCVVALRGEYKRMRTGRASTALLEHLKVEYYGSESPISQVANVIVELRNGVFERYVGNYTEYLFSRAEKLASEELVEHKRQMFLRRLRTAWGT